MVGKENFWTDIIDQPLANSAENGESIMQGQCEDVKAAFSGSKRVSRLCGGNFKPFVLCCQEHVLIGLSVA